MRAPDPEWEGLDIATKHRDIDRTKWLMQAIDWHFYKPGAEPPARLPLSELIEILTDAAEKAPAETPADQRRRKALHDMAAMVVERARAFESATD